MIPPVEPIKTYTTIYHEFSETYVIVDQVTRDFYPLAKKFVEATEPEINKQMKKLSTGGKHMVNPKPYEMLIQFMNQFDDFTLHANKLFKDIKNALEQSEAFMNKVLELKRKTSGDAPEPVAEYTGLLPELTEIVEQLKQTLTKAAEMEKQMQKLQADWEYAKQKID